VTTPAVPTLDATVTNVGQLLLGDELVSAAPAGATVLLVDDAIDFGEGSGTVRIGGVGGEILGYASVDDSTGTITLSAPTASAHAVGDRVDLWDTAKATPFVEWRALVHPAGDLDVADEIDAVVSHPLIPMLAEGVRDAGTGESVVLEQQSTGWVLTDVRGKSPQIDGGVLAAGSLTQTALGFTVGKTTATIAAAAPASPNPGDIWFDTTSGSVMKTWSGSAWTTNTFGAGAITAGAIDATKVSFTARSIGGALTTFAAAAPANPLTGDLWFDSANGYLVNQWSGSAWVPSKFGTNAILDGAVTSGKVAFTAKDIGGITTSIATAAPTPAKAGDLWYDANNGYVLNKYDGSNWNAAKFATGALQVGSVTAAIIAAHTITAAQIAAGTITATEIAASTITANQIAANTITAGQIAANTITAAQITAGTLTATEIAAGTITGALIAAGTITGDRIAAGTITADRIAAGTITADRIAAGTITGDLIAAGAIVAGQIAAGALDAVSIRSGQITSGTVQGSIISSQITGSDFVLDADNGRVLVYQQAATVVPLTGSGNYTVPAGANQLKVEAWGAGGGGGTGREYHQASPSLFYETWGGGGGGGEYAAENAYAVTAGQVIAYSVGAGGTAGATLTNGGNGGDTSFGTVVAHGGKGGLQGGTTQSGTPGAGGSGSTSTVHLAGGAGGSGGGGSSAGPTSPGNNSSGNAGATAPTGGGKGGTGGQSAAATVGSAPGGGGGAGFDATFPAGAAGGAGKLQVTYYATTLVATIAALPGTDTLTGTAYPAGMKVHRADLVETPAPIGTVQMFAGATVPAGYLLCNGAAVSRTTYAALFAVIGTTYGAGNGTTTFTLPDFGSRFPRGNTRAASGGADTHSHTFSDGGHTHPLSAAGRAQITVTTGGVKINRVATASYTSNSEANSVSNTTGGTAYSTGAGLDGATDSATASGTTGLTSNVPAYVGLQFIIKT
jgi:microcystin-dependent protein